MAGVMGGVIGALGRFDGGGTARMATSLRGVVCSRFVSEGGGGGYETSIVMRGVGCTRSAMIAVILKLGMDV